MDFIGDFETHSFRPFITALVENKRAGGSCERLEEIFLPGEFGTGKQEKETASLRELRVVAQSLGIRVTLETKDKNLQRRIRGQDGLGRLWQGLRTKLREDERDRTRIEEEGEHLRNPY